MLLFIHILLYKLYFNIKTTLDFRGAVITRNIVSLLVYGGFAYGAYKFAFIITHLMLEKTHTGLYLFHIFISSLLFVFFLAVNLGNIIVSYSTLYRSNEVEFFLTKPVSYTSIFLIKFLDNFFYSSSTLFIGAFMVLAGYGNYFGYPWYYFLMIMFLILLPFMFLSACIAVLILMGIMKLAATIGFRKVLALLFILYFIITYTFFAYSSPITMVENIQKYYPAIDSYLIQATPKILQYLPNQWVAMSLYHIARGELASALPQIVFLISITVIVFFICLIVARKFYYRSWLVSLDVKSIAAQPYDSVKKYFLDLRKKSLLPNQIEVLFKKELLLFFREASQWIHLLVMIILTGVFSISISHLNLRLRVVDIQLLTYLTIFSFGAFMVCALGLRFVFPIIGLEGKAFWSIRSSPVNEKKILYVKFLLSFLLVLIMSEYIGIASNIPFVKITAMRPLLLWFGIYSSFWISLATVSLNLGLGGYFANYLERNPIRAASSQGATITFLTTIIYLFLITSIVFIPISAYFNMLFKYKYFEMNLIILPGTLFAVISYTLFVLGLRIGLKAIKRDF